MSSDFNFTRASYFLGNVQVKSISTHSAPPLDFQTLRRPYRTWVGQRGDLLTFLIKEDCVNRGVDSFLNPEGLAVV
jgi:hypothetical protein